MFPTAADVKFRIRKSLSNPDAVSHDDLTILGGALLLCLRDDDNRISDDYAELSGGSDLQQDVTESLINLPVFPSNPTIEPLLVIFERNDQFYEAMHALIAMTIPRANNARIDPSTLCPMAIEVLRRLAATETMWDCDMTLRDRLAERGLPPTRHKLNKMLATMG